MIKMLNLLVLFSIPALAMTDLSKSEREEIDARLEAFYSRPKDASLMSVTVPKVGVLSGQRLTPNLSMKIEKASSPIESISGVKSSQQFKDHYCETFLKKRFPELECGKKQPTWAVIKGNDRVENLLSTWMDEAIYNLDKIPSMAKSDAPNWSDDYWRIRWGITSFRYGKHQSGTPFKNYKEAVSSYAQPKEWLQLLPALPEEVAKQIVKYSPSEKYDLTVGDEEFTLTNEQKNEGLQNVGANGDVEEWMGICHGWAGAAIVIDRPIKPVKVLGAKGASVEWYPADIRSMVSLAYANGNYRSNFIGGRCNDKTPKLLKNGRIAAQECFDNNPATFHLALGNLIGIAKGSFVMDATFDYEVWNQPILSYEFTYFNPLNHHLRSHDWRDVVIDYNDQFKAKDRFQNPLTRGSAIGTTGGDEKIKKVVGVIATVVYVSELSPPKHDPIAEADELTRVTYTYDLELEEQNGSFIPTGGEWHENAHPDFLWVPKKNSTISMSADKVKLDYTGKIIPTDLIKNTAKKASGEAYPLCQVLKELVRDSSGGNGESLKCVPATN